MALAQPRTLSLSHAQGLFDRGTAAPCQPQRTGELPNSILPRTHLVGFFGYGFC